MIDHESIPCFWHNVVEPVTDTTYRVCGECFHVYEIEEDLKKAFVEKGWDEEAPPGDKIFSCPLCIHDF